MKLTAIASVAVTSLLIAAPMNEVKAANFSFTGNLPAGHYVQPFDISTLGGVTLKTLSNAGGINAASNVIAPLGFDPVISLFDSAGKLVAFNDDGGPKQDSDLGISLSPGSYRATITQYPAYPRGPNLSDGFIPVDPAISGHSHWALDIFDVESATQLVAFPNVTTIPEPETYWMMLVGLALIYVVARNRKNIADGWRNP